VVDRGYALDSRCDILRPAFSKVIYSELKLRYVIKSTVSVLL